MSDTTPHTTDETRPPELAPPVAPGPAPVTAPEAALLESQPSAEADALSPAPGVEQPEGNAGETAENSEAEAKPRRPRRKRRRAVEASVTAIAGEWVLVALPDGKRGAAPVSDFVAPPGVDEKVALVQIGDAGEDNLIPFRRAKEPAPAPAAKTAGESPWKTLKRGQVIDVTVSGMNIGGLEVKFLERIRGFMPKSHIELTPPDDFQPYLKQTMPAAILEVDRKNRKIIVSRRVLLEREHRKQRLKELQPGEVLEGKVKRIEPFGILVDLGHGLEGLVRPGDLSWQHVEDPNTLVKLGDDIKGKALGIERGRHRVLLGVRQIQPDPWAEVETKFAVGAKISGTVTRLAEFGAFVELEPGIEGLIHISQLSDRRVETVEQAVRVGMTVEAKVTEVSAKRHRISLSIRALTAPETAPPTGKASRDDLRKYVKNAKNAHAGESLGALLAKFGGGDNNLKGGIG